MSKELKTGIVALVVLAMTFWGYSFLKGENIFQPNNRQFKVAYSNIGGLSKSSLVTINGLKVGKVDEILFNPDSTKRGSLIVLFSMDDPFEFSKKSIVKIYSPSPLGGSNLAIIPDYTGENAVSGDILQGEIESSLFTSIGERLDPIQTKLEHVIVSADTLFKNINDILDQRTIQSVKNSVKTLEQSLVDVRTTIQAVNGIMDATSSDLKETMQYSRNFAENLSKVSDTLVNADLGKIMREAEVTLLTVNSLLKGIDEGKGSLGKFVNDNEMYDNLTNVSKELEQLLREMKLNPKRFVHFSLFGKRATPFNQQNNNNNKTNQ
ncbi:MAG: MlaD family protein [Polaribacter sp.]|jgi:phospholipid/cholesterol/gamma-HCH transport system substrate-binding protein|nr:MlaD family protein [Polaribacter sp.]MDB9830719.1 MlaD family protein [Polaribacter sp.]MDG1245541.1 MlaD family protein [Polaribacter sp.]MDG1320923.1 MlaD family protein [Polaribacter sp.]